MARARAGARPVPGHRLELTGHPDPTLNRRFLGVAASHPGSQPGAVAVADVTVPGGAHASRS
ncbi:hypothetical protein MMSR116_29865 [Methylobacterium mesophilicum SR1.6/6]|uniref:Uncharacterized protein n=1 Tax=Methylobacterium mesophilicum SR1.6/6 TaxID=908290 RepID=A0A6B9FZ18_9HYPH|nr:hypothetical protein [Methylobacterium mesophilicum]QGY05638.1 hypothetical protein MMSR116_29865 [Methylobacterium mesophilicum SR1.6/6]